MFETLQPPPSERAKAWFAPNIVYGVWCVLGASGVFLSFWKHGAYARLGFVSYTTEFALALYFFLAARSRPHTERDVSTRSVILFLLGMIPTFATMFRM
jgi:hypothetical protein